VGSFDFTKVTLPSVHPDCARAESYLSSDPRSACFYNRRAVEGLVSHLYDVLALPLPYEQDLAALINDAAFKAQARNGINQKLNLIRRAANAAVHDNKQLAPDDLIVLEEMLVAPRGQHGDLARASEQTGGLGLFIRSLVGLDRRAAVEAFGDYLDGTRFSVDQVRFVDVIVEILNEVKSHAVPAGA